MSLIHVLSDVVTTAPVTITQLSPQQVAGLIGALMPILVSILSRWNASAQVKVWLNLALTAIVGAVSSLVVLDPVSGVPHFGWIPFLLSWLYAFIASSVAYLGALQHLSVNDLLLSLGGIFGQGDNSAEITSVPDGTIPPDGTVDPLEHDTPVPPVDAAVDPSPSTDTPLPGV